VDFTDFRNLVNELKTRKPALFDLETDPPATEDQIREAEEQLGVRFPVEYRLFVREMGGGFFGFTNVFSATLSGHWSVVERNRSAPMDLGSFLAVSDNGVGDYYGFLIEDGSCRSTVCFFDHETMGVSETRYANLFDYLAIVGLKTG